MSTSALSTEHLSNIRSRCCTTKLSLYILIHRHVRRAIVAAPPLRALFVVRAEAVPAACPRICRRLTSSLPPLTFSLRKPSRRTHAMSKTDHPACANSGPLHEVVWHDVPRNNDNRMQPGRGARLVCYHRRPVRTTTQIRRSPFVQWKTKTLRQVTLDVATRTS